MGPAAPDRAIGTGVIAFAPLASGLLTDKFLNGEVDPPAAPPPSGPASGSPTTPSSSARHILQGLNEIAKPRGQSLAQMSIAWILRNPAVTSASIGASSIKQLEENIASLKNLNFTPEELKKIDALTFERD